MPTGFQQIHPQAVELRLARRVERAFVCELCRMAGQQLRQAGECRIPPGQVIERRIACVAGVAVLFGPAPARLIIVGKRADGTCELVEQRIIAQPRLVQLRHEEAAHHHSTLERRRAGRKRPVSRLQIHRTSAASCRNGVGWIRRNAIASDARSMRFQGNSRWLCGYVLFAESRSPVRSLPPAPPSLSPVRTRMQSRRRRTRSGSASGAKASVFTTPAMHADFPPSPLVTSASTACTSTRRGACRVRSWIRPASRSGYRRKAIRSRRRAESSTRRCAIRGTRAALRWWRTGIAGAPMVWNWTVRHPSAARLASAMASTAPICLSPTERTISITRRAWSSGGDLRRPSRSCPFGRSTTTTTTKRGHFTCPPAPSCPSCPEPTTMKARTGRSSATPAWTPVFSLQPGLPRTGSFAWAPSVRSGTLSTATRTSSSTSSPMARASACSSPIRRTSSNRTAAS